MKTSTLKIGFILLLQILLNMRSAMGIRFVIDREECFSHSAPYEGDTVHVSFVVIKADARWHFGDYGVDLVVKDPSGEQIHDSRDKTSDMFELVITRKGLHRFCFTNKSPYHETIDFDLHVAHFAYYDQHAKDEHVNPLLEQIAKLEEALYNVQFEQHWLEAQTDRQALVNEQMSRRAIHKAVFESAALIGASVLQVYLLRRLLKGNLVLLECRHVSHCSGYQNDYGTYRSWKMKMTSLILVYLNACTSNFLQFKHKDSTRVTYSSVF